MSDREQSEGREKNGAAPGGRPDASTSDAAVKRTGEQSRTAVKIAVAYAKHSGGPGRPGRGRHRRDVQRLGQEDRRLNATSRPPSC